MMMTASSILILERVLVTRLECVTWLHSCFNVHRRCRATTVLHFVPRLQRMKSCMTEHFVSMSSLRLSLRIAWEVKWTLSSQDGPRENIFAPLQKLKTQWMLWRPKLTMYAIRLVSMAFKTRMYSSIHMYFIPTRWLPHGTVLLLERQSRCFNILRKPQGKSINICKVQPIILEQVASIWWQQHVDHLND